MADDQQLVAHRVVGSGGRWRRRRGHRTGEREGQGDDGRDRRGAAMAS
jgi:hypothetical protein